MTWIDFIWNLPEIESWVRTFVAIAMLFAVVLVVATDHATELHERWETNVKIAIWGDHYPWGNDQWQR